MRTKYFFLFFIIIFHINTSFVYGKSQRYEQEASNGSSFTDNEWIYLNDLIFNITNNEVIFTQDDDYFYYSITQSVTGVDEGEGWCGYHTYYKYPQYMLAPFSNINDVMFYNHVHGSNVGGNNEYYLKLAGTEIAHYKTHYTNSKFYTDKNKCDMSFICSRYQGPSGDISGFKLIESSIYHVNSRNFTIKIKFKIIKKDIEKLKYFRFIFPLYWERNTPPTGGNYNYSSGTTNYSIDLTEYTACEHNFIYESTDNSNHKKVCEFCKWEINEEHEFIYSYDEIENNRCECGHNKKIRYRIINNIDDKEEVHILDSNSDIEIYDETKKTGYSFLYYEDKEYVDNEWKNAKIYKIYELPRKADNSSHIYKKIYSAHRYKLVFNKKNNYNLNIDDEMDEQIVYYDERVKINKCIYEITGYEFKGWGVMPDIDKVLFEDNEEIINLTDIDDKAINLYPVYEPYTYTVNYHFTRENKILTKKYTYDIVEDLEKYKYYLYNNMAFVGWKYNGEIIKGNTTKILESLVDKNNKVIDLYADIYINYNRDEKSNSNENSPSQQNVKYDKNDSSKNNSDDDSKKNGKGIFDNEDNNNLKKNNDNKNNILNIKKITDEINGLNLIANSLLKNMVRDKFKEKLYIEVQNNLKENLSYGKNGIYNFLSKIKIAFDENVLNIVIIYFSLLFLIFQFFNLIWIIIIFLKYLFDKYKNAQKNDR